MNDDRFMYLT